MARGERSRPLGAHARLARRVCGAGARARRHARSGRRAASPPARPGAHRSHQVTNTGQAGPVVAADAAGRAAAGRGAADPGARRRPAARAPRAPQRRPRRQHAGNHRHRS